MVLLPYTPDACRKPDPMLFDDAKAAGGAVADIGIRGEGWMRPMV
jgi:hypothetical protein